MSSTDVFEAAAAGDLEAIKGLGRIHLEAKNDRGWTPVRCLFLALCTSINVSLDHVYQVPHLMAACPPKEDSSFRRPENLFRLT